MSELNSNFVRENRCFVIKIIDGVNYLNRNQASQLLALQKIVEDGRRKSGKAPLKCVVAEHDWPEYEITWKLIEERL